MQDRIDLDKVKQAIRSFATEREWDQFHSPKNIATALSVESSELLEIFQWINEDSSRGIMSDDSKATKIKEEVADIFYYLVRLSDLLKIDIEEEFWKKLSKNAKKYPVDLAKGTSKKYTELKK